MYRKENLITTYLIEEPLPAIKWAISGDTASFGTLHCQKAAGRFGGRDYTAWFCPDLPYHAGPWKLNGLPGLIVEAYDTNKEVAFKFDGLEEVGATDAHVAANTNLNSEQIKIFNGDNANNDPNLIALPTDAVKTTEKEFTKLQDAMRKDPQAFLASMGGGANMRMAPAGGMPSAPPPGQPQAISVTSMPMGNRVINNPLELPEKR